jgi:hypothetical protein
MSKTFNLLSVGVPLDSMTTFAEFTADADARYIKLDQTTPQTMEGLADGLLNLTLGVVGTDTTTAGLAASALQSETDPLSLHLDQTGTPQEIINGTPNFAAGATGNVTAVGSPVGFSATVSGGDGSNTGAATGLYGSAYCNDSSPAYGVHGVTLGSAIGAGGYFSGFSRYAKLAGDNYGIDFSGGFYWADAAGASDALLTVSSGVISATEKSGIYLSGFYNDLGNYGGWLTYYDTIAYAESAGYAYSADYANYCYTADYVNYENDPYFQACPQDGSTYGVNNGSWTQVVGDTSFTDWRGGTAYQPTGPCQFDDDPSTPTKYARYWNTPNSSLAEWWDGTNTFTIGGASGSSYIAGSADILATLNGTYCHFIDAGTSIPFNYVNTKDSTDSVIEFGRFGRATTGTAADGIGGKIPFYLTNDNGDQEIFAQVEVIGTDVSDGSEDSDVVLKTMIAGSLTETLRIGNALTASKIVFTDASKKLTSTGIGTSSDYVKGDGSLDSTKKLTEIYSSVLASDATSFTVSSLVGDTDEIYIIKTRIKNGYNGSVGFYIRPNNDSGANYGRQLIIGATSTASAAQSTGASDGLYLGVCTALNSISHADMSFVCKSGYLRTYSAVNSREITGTTITQTQTTVGDWSDTANQVTSLVFYANQTNGLGAGSVFKIYAWR